MNHTLLNTAEQAIHNITASFNRPVDKQFLTLENSVFGNFMFWGGLLALKMLLMSLLTFIFVLKSKDKVDEPNSTLERVRGAHRNDLENILPYLTIGILYVCVNPPPLFATILFRMATIFRFAHTLVYAIFPIPQPARLICFLGHWLITIYMAMHIIIVSITFI